MPIADRMVRVTLRTITHTIPPQDVITRDNVPARVDAVAYFRVVDADASVVDIEDYLRATSEIAKTTLRSVLGKAELDTLLSERERLNEDLQRIIDEQTEPWGIKVVAVEIKDVGIPRHAARDGPPGGGRARPSREGDQRRGRVPGRGAAGRGGRRPRRNPAAMQLRYLQTLSEIGVNQNSTVVFPLPIDLIKPLLHGMSDAAVPEPDAADAAPAALSPSNGSGRQLGAESAAIRIEANEQRSRAERS